MNAARIVVLDAVSAAGESTGAQAVAEALEQVGARVLLSADARDFADADGLVISNTGSFAELMRFLRVSRVAMMLERHLSGGRSVLGIGTGMQVMFDSAISDGTVHEGLGEWPGVIATLPGVNPLHQGLAPVRVASGSRLLKDLDGENFYFTHAVACQTDPAVALGFGGSTDATSPQTQLSDASESAVSLSGVTANKHFRAPLVSWASHGADFVAAVENGPLVGTQFHPELSGVAGEKLFANWLASL